MRLNWMFICAAFKSHTELNNAQRVGAPTTTILPTTAGTNYGLNFLRHVIYTLQISM